ncbi:MAG: hypothetical protein ACKO2L_18915 [Planctomycetaceae bacterium]
METPSIRIATEVPERQTKPHPTSPHYDSLRLTSNPNVAFSQRPMETVPFLTQSVTAATSGIPTPIAFYNHVATRHPKNIRRQPSRFCDPDLHYSLHNPKWTSHGPCLLSECQQKPCINGAKKLCGAAGVALKSRQIRVGVCDTLETAQPQTPIKTAKQLLT